MKYGIDCGHNCAPDTGASGIGSEDKMTLETGLLVIGKLRCKGHEVVDCTPKKASSITHSLQQRCKIANDANVDIFISIHYNCFNKKAHGTEVFAISQAGQELAKSVVNEIAKLGFYNRGAKSGSFYVLKNTNMPAILVEGCFVDSSKDMKLYDPDKIATAIVLGLTGA